MKQFSPEDLAFVGTGLDPAWEEQTSLAKAAHGRRRGCGAPERLEELVDRPLDGLVRIQHHLARGVIDQAHRQRHFQLAAAGLRQLAADESRSQHMQLSFRHRPLHAQQQPVIELRGVINAVLVQDQGVGQSADLEKAVPVRGAAGQPADLETEHHADLAHADGGHQALEAGPIGVCTGLAQVGVDNHHLLRLPPECHRPLAQRVLAFGRLGVLQHLAERGLADIQVCLT